MAITDPRAIRFTNECIRPLCESIRDLKARGDIVLLKWSAEVAALIPNDGSVLEDGRTSEGISILTGADINAVVGVMLALHTALEADPSTVATILKPCVNQLRA